MTWAITLAPFFLLLANAAQAETHTYKRVGNLAIQAEVHRPAGLEGNAPVLMYIHGGALIMGSRMSVNAKQLARYLEEGFVVVSIDYRLAPETKLPEIWEDVRDAYAWIRKDGPRLFQADVSRIGITGGSAGGYLTLLSAAKLKPAPKAVVSYYGYGDITGDWYAKPDAFYRKQPEVSKEDAWASVGKEAVADPGPRNQRGRFYLYTRQQGVWGELVGGGKNLVAYCPVKLVTAKYPPTLLLHGDADTDVPVEQSKEMAAELARKGVTHELILMKGAPHGFDRAMDNAEVRAAFERGVAFLKRWVKGEK